MSGPLPVAQGFPHHLEDPKARGIQQGQPTGDNKHGNVQFQPDAEEKDQSMSGWSLGIRRVNMAR